jgi:ribosomal protein L11 methyltransferase
MNWQNVQVEVEADHAEIIEEALLAIGALSIQLSDAGDEPILEPAPGEMPLWSRVQLDALFESAVDELVIRLAVASAVSPAAPPRMTFDRIDEENWVAKLREELEPLRFGRHLWVCPPGKPCPDPEATVLTMEPGLAFGTGTHQTTALCLDWLANTAIKGNNVLDYGCGSGILSIASLALGAREVTAVDIDPQAVRATRDNSLRNAGSDRLAVMLPDKLGSVPTFGILLANILSGTLIELAPTLRTHCHAGTELALSGILAGQATAVIEAFQQWVNFDRPTQRDDWVLLTGTVT